MKANKTHISLETAKLLKDCGVENEYYFVEYHEQDGGNWEIKSKIEIDKIYMQFGNFKDFYPAFTWQEILWEYAKEFFGSYNIEDRKTCVSNSFFDTTDFMHGRNILQLLQQEKYEEADEYFREKCILIK